jgi:hypothetical protein
LEKDASDRFDYFNETMRHNLVQEFALAYYTREIIPDLAEKYEFIDGSEYTHNFMTRKDVVEYIASVGGWSRVISSGTLTDSPNSEWFVKIVDKAYKDLDSLLDKYSDVDTPPDEKNKAEKELYPMTKRLMKQGRIPKEFKLQPYRDQYLEDLTLKMASMGVKMDALGRKIENLDTRLKIVEKIAAETGVFQK